MPGNSSTRQEIGIDLNLVKALAHPVRVAILESLQGRTASPVELSKELDESVGVVSHHMNVLRDLGCVEQVRTRPKRGTIEHFYSAKPRSFIGDQDWRRAPLSVRGGVTNEALRTFGAKIAAAIDDGKFDSRGDTTLNWMPVVVDEQGWREIAEVLDLTRRKLMAVAGASRERLKEADGIPVVTGLAAFEAAPSGDGPPGEKAPGPSSCP
ncbi:MAG TPA: winged helix-turn-helix domain-containing protein [Solirubrobacterales bacterium]|jgi:DNA-binding transcriptional ArsR family regulator|nr:winged helix-turn-helix domain-containing protein [Solirubrobacterales bacterium]